MKLSGPELLLVGRFWNGDPISFLIIDFLFLYYAFLIGCMFLGIYPFLLDFSPIFSESLIIIHRNNIPQGRDCFIFFIILNYNNFKEVFFCLKFRNCQGVVISPILYTLIYRP